MDHICRLCGEEHRLLVPIFSYNRDRLISDMVILICPIIIDSDESNLPNNVCKSCLQILHSAFDLREKSVQNDYRFRNGEMSPLQVVVIKEEKEDSSYDDWQTSEKDTTTFLDQTKYESDDDSNNDDDSDDEDFLIPKNIKVKKRKKRSALIIESGLFKCPECDESFHYESNLGAHFRENHSSMTIPRFKHRVKSLNCEYCGKLISQSTNYKRHLTQYHDSSLPYGCSLCTYRFSKLEKLKTHGLKFHGEPNVTLLENDNPTKTLVECDLCGKKYVDLKSLAKHMKKIHENSNKLARRLNLNPSNRISCPHCDKIVTTRSNLYRHIANAHPEKFPHPCSHCSEGFRTQRLLFNHLEKVHNIESPKFASIEGRVPLSSEPLICHFCSEDCSTSKHKLERHLISEHEHQLENVQQCPTCQKKFVYEDSWKYHLQWHQRKNSEKDFTFSCVQCNKRFPNEEKLEKHTMTHAQSSLICHICGKALKNKFSYEFHVKRHAEVRDHPCPLCPASFVYIKQLERHMVGHSEVRKYVCDHPGCTKTFKDNYTFHLHQKRHNGQLQRKYECTYIHCDKKFFSKYALDRHYLTHTLQKPHQCEYCDAAYAQKNDLVKHLKIHVGDDIYRCTIDGCFEAFRLQADLKRHYAVHYINT